MDACTDPGPCSDDWAEAVNLARALDAADDARPAREAAGAAREAASAAREAAWPACDAAEAQGTDCPPGPCPC